VSFQKSAVRATATASLMRGLIGLDPPGWRRPLLATGYLLAGDAVERATRPREASLWVRGSQLFGALGAAQLVADIAHDQFARATVVDQFSAVHEFVESLVEIRMIGSPKPRAVAEQLTSLLGELFGTIPVGRPSKHLRQLPVLRSKERPWQQSTEYFEDCSQALGRALKEFTFVARADLGRGKRWWQHSKQDRTQFWQFWRPAGWPGGWPGPDGRALVQINRQRSSALSSAMGAQP
jgi:hypothetical protein